MIPVFGIILAVAIYYFVGSMWAFLMAGICLLFVPIFIMKAWNANRRALANYRKFGNIYGLPGCQGLELDEYGIPVLNDHDSSDGACRCGCGESMAKIKEGLR